MNHSSAHKSPIDALIQLALRQRVVVVAIAVLVSLYGAVVLTRLPIDVFPDLNRPTVSILTEAGGLSPEEVEVLVVQPLERGVMGAPGVERVRSVSGVGLGIVHVEFGFDVDVIRARQVVAERLQTVTPLLPAGTVPQMGPMASIMGEILLVGVAATREGSATPMALRTLADTTLRPRLLTVPGVAQVVAIGGEVRQVQVLVDPQRLVAYGVTLDDVERAAGLAQQNTTGGFLESQAQEVLVRNVARTTSLDAIADTPVAFRDGLSVRLRQVATVREGPAQKRGDAGVNGKPAVVLSIQKQPATSTTTLTAQIEGALAELSRGLPAGVTLVPLFRQATFIETAVENVTAALRDGALLVAIVLVLFLLNARTTIITLTAIPLSMVVAVLVFSALGLSLNTMTLGGLAVAVGELVDDAIVDVENVYRRLRENAARDTPEPPLLVIFRASSEVRGSIVFATALVVLVFVPLFAMDGIEGRLFVPLGLAYVVSILASLLVSLTVTPALCALLLAGTTAAQHDDSRFVRALKAAQERVLSRVLLVPDAVLVAALLFVVAAAVTVPLLPRAFLPAFNEGTATINIFAPPGTSLAESNRLGTLAEEQIGAVPEVRSTGRRTGRAEMDEHAEGVHYTEIDVDFDDVDDNDDNDVARPRAVVLAEIRDRLALLPGVTVNIGQPISHRLDHLLSGVRAEVVIKLFGPDLTVLRSQAAAIHAAIVDVDGVTDLAIEQQVLVPQVRVRVDRERAARLGMPAGELAERLEGALAGKRVGQILDGARTVDIVVRFDEAARADVFALGRALIDTPSGAQVPLSSLAEIVTDRGPNQILHDNGARRLVVAFNVDGRALDAVVDDVRARVDGVARADGVSVVYEGQFESQARASRLLFVLALAALCGMIVVLHAHLRSLRLVVQVLVNIPLALIGSVAALWLFALPLSVATLIGFITLCGIAARNSILLLDHYLQLIVDEGLPFAPATILRGSRERLVPVLMTALTAGLALVPLAFAAGAPGKEILHPVAVVILGGLLSSTLLDLVVTPAAFLRFARPAVDARLAARAAPDPFSPAE